MRRLIINATDSGRVAHWVDPVRTRVRGSVAAYRSVKVADPIRREADT